MNKVNESYQTYMFNFMKKVCDEIGPRIGWSENERKAAYMIKNELKQYCDEVDIEDFQYTRSFYMMFRIPLILNLTGIFLYILILFGFQYSISLTFSIISTTCFSLSIFFLVSQFLFNKDTMSIFTKSGTSQNVVGKIKPKKEAQKILIFSGHHDSTWHFPLMDKLGEKMILFMYITIFFLFASLIFSVINMFWVIFQMPYNMILDLLTRIIFIGSIPFIGIFSLFMIDRSRPTLGAGDNLSGVVVALGIAKYLADNSRPDNVEVWCVSFGSEEGGLHGSRAFVKKHFNELSNAIVINSDDVGRGKIKIVKNEMLVHHDKRVIDLIDKAANNLGIPHTIAGGGGGRTDAWSFTTKNFLATTMIALEDGKKMPPDYHTVRDTPYNKNFDPRLLKEALMIDLEIINLIDKGEFTLD
ncbi:MAG: M28 family metallopeptidase [Candidatus Helarchaeota archaeon]